ncbi:MAG TPA: PRC-barrel domain-containing protein [Nitrospira sp.]|nr:PRC-barrel domain-containing protein [Nitrospira sp.]
MNTVRVLLQAIAATGLLGMFGMIHPGNVSSQELLSEIGKPMPGTTQDFEDTRKQPDPAQMHSPESNRQVTLGGAQSFVEGEVLDVNGQQFEIKKTDDGERVQLVVNQDSNLDCSAAPAGSDQQDVTFKSERIPADKQAPAASERQREQGQRKNETARGAGFQIGQCDFHPGDRVKAEVDDMGRVTTMKYLAKAPAMPRREIGESAGTGLLAMPGQQDKPGQLDMTGAGGSVPKEYTVIPVPVGELTTAENNVLLNKPVKDTQGHNIGTLEKLIMDTHSGRIEYAIVAIENGTHLHPVPWSAIQVKRNGGPPTAMIDTAQFQLMPSLMRDDSKDLSPSVKQIVNEMQVLRDREPRKSQSREQIVKEPAGSGPMGEDKAGGDGLSGTRALPPEKDSPGYEHAKDKRD